MQGQRRRRANPYPFTWEIPVAALIALLVLFLIGVQTGRSVANLLTGNGWVMVDRKDLFTSLVGILSGDAAAGLADVSAPASPPLLWTAIVVCELVIGTGSALVLTWGLRRWGPSRMRGMATRLEAEQLLGRRRLRRHAKVIRPDLTVGWRQRP